MYRQLAIHRLAFLCVAIAMTSLWSGRSLAADEIELAGGTLTMSKPEGWKKVDVKSGILEAEMAIPKVDGDADDGRITFMAAGGGVEANIERWKGQFQPGGDKEKVESKTEKKTIAGATVHLVDLSGNFNLQSGGPFGPSELKKDYRMLAAIIVQDDGRQYFVKLVGPDKTIKENAEKFQKMIESLKIKK